jgi:hypothetical protein
MSIRLACGLLKGFPSIFVEYVLTESALPSQGFAANHLA